MELQTERLKLCGCLKAGEASAFKAPAISKETTTTRTDPDNTTSQIQTIQPRVDLAQDDEFARQIESTNEGEEEFDQR